MSKGREGRLTSERGEEGSRWGVLCEADGGDGYLHSPTYLQRLAPSITHSISSTRMTCALVNSATLCMYPAIVRVRLFPSSLEKAYEPSGQVMPGCNSNSLTLCPRLSRWTRPCSTTNTPGMALITLLLLS